MEKQTGGKEVRVLRKVQGGRLCIGSVRFVQKRLQTL